MRAQQLQSSKSPNGRGQNRNFQARTNQRNTDFSSSPTRFAKHGSSNANLDSTLAAANAGGIGSGLIHASPLPARKRSQTGTSATKSGHYRQNTQLSAQKTPTKTTTVSKQILPAGLSFQQKYEVYMRCVTWSRDSHGLFDYESKNIAKKNIKTQTGGKILRVNDDVEFVSIRTKPEDVDEAAKPMIIVRQQQGQFQVENDTIMAQQPLDAEGNPIADEDVNNKMFVVVRNTKSAQNNLDYKLNRGDVIKLGRIKFNVKDYRTRYNESAKKQDLIDEIPEEIGEENKIEDTHDHRNCGGKHDVTPTKQMAHDRSLDSLNQEFEEEVVEIDCGVVDPTSSDDIQCKICWDNTSTAENPLLNSCNCSGSVRFIHYECLKHWLIQKMSKKEEANLISYSWKQFECELCKKPYPYVFRSNGISYRLIDVEPDIPHEKNYLLLESLTFEKNSSRMVHLIMPDSEKTTFKLGRGHESDVRVSDISVSRCHALVKYNADNGRFYLEDNLSKFGTLVLAKGQIELEPEMTKAVQIGRSVISFTVKPYIPQPSAAPQAAIESKMVLKTPSPLKPAKNNKLEVEEMLRQKIEDTNLKINQLMSSAMKQKGAQHTRASDKKVRPSGSQPRIQVVNRPYPEEEAKSASALELQNQTTVQNGSNLQPMCNISQADSQMEQDYQMAQSLNDEMNNLANLDFGDIGNNINLQHLLRATNHLKIAQNEFELAKKMLQQKGAASLNRQNTYQAEAAQQQLFNPEILRLQSQKSCGAEYADQQQQHLPMQIHHNGFAGEDPYEQQVPPHQRQQMQRTGSSKKYGGNLSDQKTPNGHPNTFLYRAHLNLNELGSAQQEDYSHVDQLQRCNQGDVSAFYNDELDKLCLMEEQKEEQECQPLRLPANDSERPTEARRYTRNSDIETTQPIMQLMQMHQQQQSASKMNKYAPACNNRFSNLSGSSQNQNGNNASVFSDDSARMMMGVSDELSAGCGHHERGVAQRQSSLQQMSGTIRGPEYREEHSRGRQQVQTYAPPMIKKNPSSPSKMFKQGNPTLITSKNASKSPYRHTIRDASEATSIGPKSGASYCGSTQHKTINISPIKQSLSKYCNDKATGNHNAGSSSIQNVHQRLREYQGSQGKTSVSRALFQHGECSPSKLQSKTASAFGQNLRF